MQRPVSKVVRRPFRPDRISSRLNFAADAVGSPTCAASSQTPETLSNSRHILVACHAWYEDVIGGSFRLASEFAQYLARRGNRVSYVCCAPAGSGNCDPERTADGVDVYRYPPPEGLGSFRRMRYHVNSAFRLAQRVHEQQSVNAVSSHSPLQGLGAARFARGVRAFVNYTVHSPFDDELLSNQERSGLLSRAAAYFARRTDRENVRLADRVQTDSHYTFRNFREKYGSVMDNRGVVAPGWVDTQHFRPVADRRRARSELSAPWHFDGPVFFTLRRLEQRMGLDTLVDAAARTAEQTAGSDFRVLIGGGGSLRGALEDQIQQLGLKDRVFLLGRLPEEHLSAAYAAADCFVLPTRALECFGLIVLEAFACNTPVIASTAAAIPEIASKQGDDWLFDPGDVAALTDRMKSFLAGELPSERPLRGIAEEYDRQLILQRWESLLLPQP